MKYIAKPVEVEAHRIVGVIEMPQPGNTDQTPSFALELENGDQVIATPEMTSRMTPSEGDYWVIQEDGYIYLNPKEVFERKYSPLDPA